jgi:hypothetical protein
MTIKRLRPADHCAAAWGGFAQCSRDRRQRKMLTTITVENQGVTHTPWWNHAAAKKRITKKRKSENTKKTA